MGFSRGLDVSVYQGPQDWAALKAGGLDFAFAKASEGQHTRDAHFKQHITGIKAAGLVPGAYHYAWPNQAVGDEAANYTAAVKPYAGPGFVHWLDLERRSDGANYSGVSAAQIQVWVSQWIALVQKAFPGQRVGVYTSGDDLAKGRVPAGVSLWYPAYPGTSADEYAEAEAHARPKPSGRSPLIWQFTSNPRTGPNLDLNIAYLSEADLRTWAAGNETDMPLSPQDKAWITSAIAAGITANAFKAVVQTDEITAPADAPDVATNPKWRLDSYTKDTNARARLIQAALANPQSVTLTDAQVQALATNPALAEAIAEKVAAKLAERLAS